MEKNINRKLFQGVFNIVRFNWHFYLIAFLMIFLVYFFKEFSFELWKIIIFLILFPVIISLLVSYYVYDFKDFYSLRWLNLIKHEKPKKILNIIAGFDETSAILSNKFPNSDLKVFDFYNPEKNTEISIERARKAYPAYKNTIVVEANNLPIQNEFSDLIFLIFAAHEIRKSDEKIALFKEMNRILNKNGKIIVVEHLRDFPNFLAFNIGFFHFYSKKSWLSNIEKANLRVSSEYKLTIFTSLFIIEKNGNSF